MAPRQCPNPPATPQTPHLTLSHPVTLRNEPQLMTVRFTTLDGLAQPNLRTAQRTTSEAVSDAAPTDGPPPSELRDCWCCSRTLLCHPPLAFSSLYLPPPPTPFPSPRRDAVV